MPTNLPTRRRANEIAERCTLLALVAAICAFMGLSLIEPAFTDTAAVSESSDLFSEIAAF